MQRIGWFKSMWNRMFKPSRRTQEVRVEVDPRQAKKQAQKIRTQYERGEQYGFGFMTSLLDYLYDVRGVSRRKVARPSPNPHSLLHYLHRGSIWRKRFRNRADRRRSILAARARVQMLAEANAEAGLA